MVGINFSDIAIPNSSSQSAANAAALTTATASGLPIYIGDTFYIEPVTLPSGATLCGKGKLIMGGTAGPLALLTVLNATQVSIEGIGLEVNAATYPGATAVLIIRGADCRVERCTINAPRGIQSGSSYRLRLRDNHIASYTDRGIYLTPVDDVRCDDIWIEGNVVEGGGPSSYEAIIVNKCNHVSVKDNHVRGGNNFGISVQDALNAVIEGNIIAGTRIEALVAGGSRFIVADNIADLNGASADMGMSFYGTNGAVRDFLITANIVSASYMTGIGLGSNLMRGLVSGNYIFNPGQGNIVGWADGIALHSDTAYVPQFVFVEGNATVEEGGHMVHTVAEYATPHPPDNNGIANNVSRTDAPLIVGTHSKLWNNNALY